jgi:hypothetical protein
VQRKRVRYPWSLGSEPVWGDIMTKLHFHVLLTSGLQGNLSLLKMLLLNKLLCSIMPDGKTKIKIFQNA